MTHSHYCPTVHVTSCTQTNSFVSCPSRTRGRGEVKVGEGMSRHCNNQCYNRVRRSVVVGTTRSLGVATVGPLARDGGTGLPVLVVVSVGEEEVDAVLVLTSGRAVGDVVHVVVGVAVAASVPHGPLVHAQSTRLHRLVSRVARVGEVDGEDVDEEEVHHDDDDYNCGR